MNVNSVVRSKSIFSKDIKKKHRYLLKKVWDSEKPVATIIMLNPREETDALYLDKSVMLFMNYCISKRFGGLYIVNLFSYRSDSVKKLKKINYSDRYDSNTDKWIEHAVKSSSVIYIGWGSNKNKIIRINKVKEMLRKYSSNKIIRLTTDDNKAVHISRSTLKMKEIIIKDIDKI